MIRFRFIALALIALGLSAGIVRLAIRELERTQHASAGERRASGAGQRLSEVETQLEQLQRQLEAEQQERRLELQAQRDEFAQLKRALVEGQRSDLATAQEHPAPSPEEIERADRDREQRWLAQLEGVFEGERMDRAWSRDAVEQIASAAEQVAHGSSASGASLVDTQCRATLCRLEVAAHSLDAVDAFSRMFPAELGWQGSMKQTIVHEADGSLTGIIYVSRDGRDLPAESGGL